SSVARTIPAPAANTVMSTPATTPLAPSRVAPSPQPIFTAAQGITATRQSAATTQVAGEAITGSGRSSTGAAGERGGPPQARHRPRARRPSCRSRWARISSAAAVRSFQPRPSGYGSRPVATTAIRSNGSGTTCTPAASTPAAKPVSVAGRGPRPGPGVRAEKAAPAENTDNPITAQDNSAAGPGASRGRPAESRYGKACGSPISQVAATATEQTDQTAAPIAAARSRSWDAD